MKLRILKKYAKARHTYGFSKQGLMLEMEELRKHPSLMKNTPLRFWTYYRNKNCKNFKKKTGRSKNRYHEFYLLTVIDMPKNFTW